jgi:hypothetical protein
LVDKGFAEPGFLDFLLTRDTVADLMRSLEALAKPVAEA